MRSLIAFSSMSILWLSCTHSPNQQARTEPRLVGGPCEGCEAVFEFGNVLLTSVDTLPGFYEEGTSIKVTGTIYLPDGQTPAEGVILYVYHTDQNGIYATRGEETGWGQQHGYNRGWMKTGPDGKYTFYTQKPGSYLDGRNPAHIHPTILEPDGKYYWLEDFYFAGDPLLTERETAPTAPRGGSPGVLILQPEGTLLTAERNFVLGRHIPNYP